MRWLLLTLGVWVVIIVRLRRRWLAQEASAIDRAIASNRFRPIYEGHDDGLRQHTDQRRTEADKLKQQARQIETRGDYASKIHLVR